MSSSISYLSFKAFFLSINILTFQIPFSIVRLPSVSAARTLVSRSMLVDFISELWAHALTYDILHSIIKQQTPHLWEAYKTVSFKFSINGFYGHRSQDSSRNVINSFKYLDFSGPILLKGAQEDFTVFELWPFRPPGLKLPLPEAPDRVYFGRVVGQGDRDAIQRFSLKKRGYINTTSMDAHLSLITANLAHAAPGRVFIDPFAGTGGFCLSAAYFGAVTIGADIDGRVLRGDRKGKSVKGNFKQYGLEGGWMDGVVADLTNTPFRKGASQRWVHGIVCDPPYGVREGCKVLGTTKKVDESLMKDGVLVFK
jgi:tRNA (guanine10-N2)-methyltransferase